MEDSKKFRGFFVTASFLIIIALIIWLIPTIFLGTVTGGINKLELKNRLTEAENQYIVDLQWTQIWWETEQVSVFNPIALVVFVIGLLVMVYGVIAKFGW